MAGWITRLRPDAGLRRPLALVVAPFVVAGVLSPLYSTDEFGTMSAWQAVILWPIGALLLVGPVAILRGVARPAMFRLGLVAVAVVGVVAVVIVARSDDAQAGTGFIAAPLYGSLVAGLLVLIDRRRRP